ncbi:MAG: tyrosine-protein phosphatase SIW14 [Pseudohongiellaceae bacterium]|jgi:tyrosine-protein phosphatase SIW14
MSLIALFLAATSSLCLTPFPGDDDTVTTQDRPAHWAQALPQSTGFPNAWAVTSSFSRGAQPAAEGFAQLRRLGVKTVLNLRTLHSDRELCAAAGLDYIKVTVQAWETEREEILEVLEVLTDEAKQPVFLHCQHGADRTGAMTALYRMVVQGWSRSEAIAEMTSGGFGFHSIWVNLVSSLEEIDIDKLRVELEQRQQESRAAAARHAIRKAWREHIAAGQLKDIERVMEIYANDAVYIVGDTDLRGKAALRAHEQQSFAGSTVIHAAHTIHSLRVLGHTAFELGHIVGPVALNGAAPQTVNFPFMARWVKGAGQRWRLQTLVGQS